MLCGRVPICSYTYCHLCMFLLIVMCVTEVTFGIYALYGGLCWHEHWYEDRLTSCQLLSGCEHLTETENCCWIQKAVRPTRSPRQQWPPRRTKNVDLSIVFFSRVGLRTYQLPCSNTCCYVHINNKKNHMLMPCQTGKRNNNFNTHTYTQAHTHTHARTTHEFSHILWYPTWLTDGLATCTATMF